MFLLRRVQVLHYPVVLLTLALQIISTGTVSMEDQNRNFLYSPTTLQKKLRCLMKIQDSLLMWQKGNMWIWRSPPLLYQTLLCTTVLCSPQWQETHQLTTKTCYNKRQEREREIINSIFYNLMQKGSKHKTNQHSKVSQILLNSETGQLWSNG